MERDSPDTQAQLAALADGTLSGAQSDRLRDQIERSPELGQEAQRQRQAVEIVGSLAGVAAPATLHRSVQSMVVGASNRRRARRPLRLRLTAAGALAALAAVALVIALSAGSPSAPKLTQAADFALRPATLPAPAQSTSRPGQLTRSVQGIAYPYWQDSLGWRAAGMRVDRLAGRTVTTVFYSPRHSPHGSSGQVGYAIVAGRALPIPGGGSEVSRRGIDFHVLASAGATVVTWRRAGHTCILAARDVSSATLEHLASWQ
jgi:hypothetical protein